MKLHRILRKMKNKIVKVETKDNVIIEGSIQDVDKTLNIQLLDAKVGDQNHGPYMVRGSSIRYVLFQDDINFDSILLDDRPKKRKAKSENLKKRREKL